MKIQFATPEATEMKSRFDGARIIFMQDGREVPIGNTVSRVWKSWGISIDDICEADGVEVETESITFAKIVVAAGTVAFEFAKTHGVQSMSDGSILVKSADWDEFHAAQMAACEPFRPQS